MAWERQNRGKNPAAMDVHGNPSGQARKVACRSWLDQGFVVCFLGCKNTDWGVSSFAGLEQLNNRPRVFLEEHRESALLRDSLRGAEG